MNSSEIGMVLIVLSAFFIGVHTMGYIFAKLRQPPLVGEILAGVLLGPFVLGNFFPSLSSALFGGTSAGADKIPVVLDFLYWMGLLFLMFISGSETRRLLSSENQKETAWLLGIGTPLPFLIVLALGLAGKLPLGALTGSAGEEMSTLLVLSIAVAVTSIPVISRIFHDLNILHTRFASLILGSAVLEDIALWGVLAVATAIVGSGAAMAEQHVVTDIVSHVGATLIYIAVSLTLMPVFLKWLHSARYNFLIKTSPVAYVILILFLYAALATLFNVTLVFAAFLAGFGLVGGMNSSERHRFVAPLDSVSKFSFAVFIPFYFAMVGYKLVLGNGFSLAMLLVFLAGSSVLSLISVGLAARLAGFRGLDIVNLAVTTNARGGPGIVLASVAYDAGIINAPFYTTLVLTAVLTSQAAGAWLRFVLSKNWPLLSKTPGDVPAVNPPPRSNKI